MLYPRMNDKNPDPELFRNPGAEYRCTPFWAWNCGLEEGLLKKEIRCMKEMGMGGFHMHTRSGMAVPYLSEAFMDRIRMCTEEARKEGMLAWLYDEDRWPSGFAGGYVTEKEENRQRYLLMTPKKETAEEGKILARYTVTLDGRGSLAGYRRLEENETAEGVIWYAAEKITAASPWFHFHGYVDTMNATAIRDFLRITHERYYEALGDDFGTTCPAIFTDEPQMPRKVTLNRSADLQDVLLDWTSDLEESYRAAYGESLLDRLPEVIWEMPEGISTARYRYFDHTTERFAVAYCDQIGEWCREHGILMTGHMMDEGSLESQSRSIGEAMRAYRAFTLPGIDMLCDGREYVTAKQAASAAHQQGAPGVTSELYGVTNWDFDFKGHKLQGDWQAAMGVTVRVPHLYWCSMHGEAKRDYPASIGHQSCWWKEYSYIENHFARVNTMMTRGKPLIRIGVIHPVESCWIAFGPDDRTALKRAELDRKFAELTGWLLADTLDFDYICESTLPMMRRAGDGFTVGEMRYDAVIVAGCETIRGTTLAALREFREKGGKVIFLGAAPMYVDAVPSREAEKLSERCERLPWDRVRLNESLEALREIRIRTEKGRPAEGLICAIREDGGNRNVFIVHAKKAVHGRVETPEKYFLSLKGLWTAEKWDTMTGEITPLAVSYTEETTEIEWRCWGQDSLLMRLAPAKAVSRETGAREAALNGSYGIRMSEELSAKAGERSERMLKKADEILRDEDNVLLLDYAQWRTDEEDWEEEEEMLRIGLRAKKKHGISTAAASGAQPWILPPEQAEHTLSLRIRFFSRIRVEKARLAMEDAEECRVWINGEEMSKEADGYFTDESIRCYPMGPILEGENIITITRPLTARTCVENLFVLGDFGVSVCGAQTEIIPAPRTLEYGDWTGQGLPFYSGKLTYRYHIAGGERMKIRLGLFAAPCVTAEVDGKRIGNLSLAPSEADPGMLAEGEHVLDLTVYPSRINSFGTFHLNDETVVWFGPQAWRSTGERWTRMYRLAPVGLLSEPQIVE